jgi:hypothetical protein
MQRVQNVFRTKFAAGASRSWSAFFAVDVVFLSRGFLPITCGKCPSRAKCSRRSPRATTKE